MNITKPKFEDVPNYFIYYLNLFESDDLLLSLENNKVDIVNFFSNLPEGYHNYSYAQDKWSVIMVFQHIIDCERLYTHRAFRFSRFDTTILSDFNVNTVLNNIESQRLKMNVLIQEFISVRNATIQLFKTMDSQMLDFKGKASNMSFSARGLGFMCVGHSLHHINFVKDNYLDIE